MDKSLNFDVLNQFVEFARGASDKDELNCNAFKNADGSFLSLLLEKYKDASRALKTFSILSSTLTELSRLVEEGLASARGDLLPGIYKRGIYSLPFEVVAHIFELLHDDDGSRRALLSANRYFRNIALKVPKLWTTVDSHQNPQLFLERSRSLGMDITHEISNSDVHAERFFDLLQPHLERWKSLSIRKGTRTKPLDDLENGASSLLQRLWDDNKGKTFPALETLHVDYGTDAPRDDEDIVLTNEEDPNASIRSFFHSWDMPALRCVDVVGFIPMLPTACLRNLTCFRLKLQGERGIDLFIYDLQAIAEFLHSLSALQELSIDLMLVEFSEVGCVPVEMPHLKTLDFRPPIKVEPILPLLDILSAPNLRELSISTETVTLEDTTNIFEAIFPENKPRWPQLEILSCSSRCLEVKYDSNMLDVLCTRLPRLHHLTIQASTFYQPEELRMHDYYEQPSWNLQPPLRTLRFLNCMLFNTSFIFGLAKIVNSPEFEMLEIDNCPNINTEVVRKLIPEGKKFICKESDWSHDISRFKSTMPGRPSSGFFEYHSHWGMTMKVLVDD